MQNEIIILCNSPECLNEISSGQWPNLHTQNIFTCNLAYTYFRTNGKHYNMFADSIPINDFLSNPNWCQIYDTYKYTGIQFVFNVWQLQLQNVNPITSHQFNANYTKSPVVVPASSAISALFYLSAVQNYNKIHLVGYTINEWEGIENVKELKDKQNAFNDLYKKYKVTKVREFVYCYEKI